MIQVTIHGGEYSVVVVVVVANTKVALKSGMLLGDMLTIMLKLR